MGGNEYAEAWYYSLFIHVYSVISFLYKPSNPYSNPDNAIIQADSSLAALKDTLKKFNRI